VGCTLVRFGDVEPDVGDGITLKFVNKGDNVIGDKVN
jgi:hypothetical protein